jgi:type II secretory pathway pseudopilin PulG
LLVVVAIIALLISILLPSLSRARELAKRAVCRANLRGIGQGEHIYANDNYEWFPHDYYTMNFTAPQQHGIDFITYMANEVTTHVTSWQSPDEVKQTNPSRSMFLLVVKNQSTPGQFTCPSSGDTQDPLRNYLGDASNEKSAQPGYNRFDFYSYNALSYGYQLPFGRRGKPRESLDTRMPINADKSPFFELGDALTWCYRDKLREDLEVTDFGTPQQILKTDNDAWRPYNSRNHNGEGQSILFVDGHVEFAKRPIAGVNNDNIYTYSDGSGGDGYTFKGTMIGLPPADKFGPLTESDALIVP